MKTFTHVLLWTTKRKVVEGGFSRNAAIHSFFINNTNAKVYGFEKFGVLSKIIDMFRILYLLIFLKGKVILINSMLLRGLFISIKITNYKLFNYLLLYLLKFSSSNNKIYIEVNDLPIEQSACLSLDNICTPFQDNILFCNKRLFYVFASQKMMEYVKSKYKIPNDNCSVLLNGGRFFKIEKNNHAVLNRPLRFIYAGTLNPGRGIEWLLSNFSKSSHELHLIGDGGKWLENNPNIAPNIFYYPPLSDDKLQKFIIKFDCGIIHYDESKFYYNICFPSKASMYVASGLPFLSTNLSELKYHFFSSQIFIPALEWANFLSSTEAYELINKSKIKTQNIATSFTWDVLLSDWLSKIKSL